MYPRRQLRWNTRFGQWVNNYTVSRIVADLGRQPDTAVTKRTVYSWLSGQVPRPDRAKALADIAGGTLTLDEIYDHRSELARLSRDRRPR